MVSPYAVTYPLGPHKTEGWTAPTRSVTLWVPTRQNDGQPLPGHLPSGSPPDRRMVSPYPVTYPLGPHQTEE
ncbi:hypothetical protein DPMN_073002 [Dreissena polymorpha]|uniref:Uncharacterized protein n=1 Tax=Dreissena polymorpha TaxID=45954 RepID=A0A9D4HA85_DREPO|nr:hypothetical protein DPMN_073002 [Dreissena polymorpha]